MSQQINLILPELRRRRDWLSFPIVAGASLAGLLLIVGLAVWSQREVDSLNARHRQGEAELATLRQRVQALGQALAARRPNPALKEEVARLAEGLRQRNTALDAVESGRSGSREGSSGVLRGFARQTAEGVWLTGFVLAGSEVEIRGRLSDAALLPHYIQRLNGEPIFKGRRFAALDMSEGSLQPATPAPVAPAATPAPAPSASAVPQGAPGGRRFTEFVLHGKLPPPGGER
ncbi:MAG: PilN domain-containing protein [Azonexus sp.]|nr:PilN domain-containing protein [Betaproteobacteria bacterium]MBK8916850.1 PilN domain-containing protein [Betaproteobacteria bacterium]MBP6036999.1 PilN domain-containing protein [Azonexus sp.]MBP6907588.1 PilN domain-containing protein [Azonexus sp.]